MFLVYYVLCCINACDVTLVTFIIRISRSYAILVGAEHNTLKTYKKPTFRTETLHSLGLPRGDNHVKLRQ